MTRRRGKDTEPPPINIDPALDKAGHSPEELAAIDTQARAHDKRDEITADVSSRIEETPLLRLLAKLIYLRQRLSESLGQRIARLQLESNAPEAPTVELRARIKELSKEKSEHEEVLTLLRRAEILESDIETDRRELANPRIAGADKRRINRYLNSLIKELSGVLQKLAEEYHIHEFVDQEPPEE